MVWSSSLLLFSPWIELRGQLVQKLLFFLEADFGEIGWFCIITFFRGGLFLQKRTTGAVGRNSKDEPSAFLGSGPSCCCRRKDKVINEYNMIVLENYW